MKRYVSDVLAIALLTFTIGAVYARLFWPQPQLLMTPDYSRSDTWHFSMATKYLLWENIQNNTLPLWVKEVGQGYPLLAEGQTGIFFIPNLILYRLLDFVTAYNLLLVLSFLMLGWGMYALLRSLDMVPFASLFGALTLALGGTVIVQVPHIALLQGFSLLPALAAVTLRMLRSKSWKQIVLFAFISSQQIFAGFPQATFISLLLCFSLVVLAAQGWGDRIRNTIRLTIGCIGMILLSALQLLPSYEFLANSLYPKGFSPDVASYYSFPLKHLITFLAPFALGNPGSGTYPHFREFGGSIFWENAGYIGILPLVCVVVTAAVWKRFDKHRKRMLLIYVFLLVASFFLMLGSHSPLYIIYSLWPFNLFRVPSRFIWLFVTSLLVIASYVVSALWQLFRHRVLMRIVLSVLVVGNTIQLIHTWYGYHPTVNARDWLGTPPAVEYIPEGTRIATVGSEAAYYSEFVTRGWKDMSVYFFLRNSLAPDANVFWGISQADIYAGRQLRRQTIIESLILNHIELTPKEATADAFAQKLMNQNAVGAVIGVNTLHQTDLQPVFSLSEGSVPITVYANPHALPRVYLATRIVGATTVNQAITAMLSDTFIPGRDVLLEKPVTLRDTDGTLGIVTFTDEGCCRLHVHVGDNGRDAVLVVADTFYPGWSATIDNAPTQILAANIRHRAVIVPKGDHDVVFSYQPRSVGIGARISGATAALIVLLMVLPWSWFASRIGKKVLPHARRQPDSHGR